MMRRTEYCSLRTPAKGYIHSLRVSPQKEQGTPEATRATTATLPHLAIFSPPFSPFFGPAAVSPTGSRMRPLATPLGTPLVGCSRAAMPPYFGSRPRPFSPHSTPQPFALRPTRCWWACVSSAALRSRVCPSRLHGSCSAALTARPLRAGHRPPPRLSSR